MYSLRQRTWGIFIRPYIVYGNDRLMQRGNLSVLNPCQNPNNPCPQYVQVKDGSPWMLYKNELFTSFTLAKEKVKEIMDTLGYSKDDIMVCEIVPIDTIVSPLT